MRSQTIDLRVHARRAEALDVMSVELRDPTGAPLPEFVPGAHIEIEILSGGREKPFLRHYSICSDPAERDRYVVAIGRADGGRGGSIAAHDLLHKGLVVAARPPRTHFGFSTGAQRYRFIAGGIGITPILSMVRWCERNGKPWTLLYCARGRHRAAFYEELRAFGDRVRFHFSDEEPRNADFAEAMAAPRPGEQAYCCGPTGLMQAVEAEANRWPGGAVRFERFGTPVNDAVPTRTGFQVVLRRSHKCIDVPGDQSILEALKANGIEVPFACREGLCRSCEVQLCAGEAEHLDHVLSDGERVAQTSLLVCVSRARSPSLEIDL